MIPRTWAYSTDFYSNLKKNTREKRRNILFFVCVRLILSNFIVQKEEQNKRMPSSYVWIKCSLWKIVKERWYINRRVLRKRNKPAVWNMVCFSSNENDWFCFLCSRYKWLIIVVWYPTHKFEPKTEKSRTNEWYRDVLKCLCSVCVCVCVKHKMSKRKNGSHRCEEQYFWVSVLLLLFLWLLVVQFLCLCVLKSEVDPR